MEKRAWHLLKGTEWREGLWDTSIALLPVVKEKQQLCPHLGIYLGISPGPISQTQAVPKAT